MRCQCSALAPRGLSAPRRKIRDPGLSKGPTKNCARSPIETRLLKRGRGALLGRRSRRGNSPDFPVEILGGAGLGAYSPIPLTERQAARRHEGVLVTP